MDVTFKFCFNNFLVIFKIYILFPFLGYSKATVGFYSTC